MAANIPEQSCCNFVHFLVTQGGNYKTRQSCAAKTDSLFILYISRLIYDLTTKKIRSRVIPHVNRDDCGKVGNASWIVK